MPKPKRKLQPDGHGHNRQRQGDEIFCPKCTRRWDAGEDEPECKAMTMASPDVASAVLSTFVIAAVDILTAAEETIPAQGAITEDDANALRKKLVEARTLLAITDPNAKKERSDTVKDIEQAMDAVRYQLQMHPNPYTWAVTYFSDSILKTLDPMVAGYIKQTLRDFFAESGHRYAGWE